MGVDKKSDHVGNHDGRYTDMEGQTRQFTYVDHDIKPKMTMPITEGEFSEAKQQLKEYRERLIQKILALPAAALPVSINHTFGIFRNHSVNEYTWNEDALRDPAIELHTLQAVESFTSAKSK